MKHKEKQPQKPATPRKPQSPQPIPTVGQPVKLADVSVSRRPQSIIPQLAAMIREQLGALVKGEALPVENISASQRTQLVKELMEKGAKFTHGYNTQTSTLYLWME